MEDNKDQKPIDVTQIIKKLWPHRKKYYYVLPATLIITYLFTLFVPRYYRCTVSLAPETSGSSFSGSLESLASSFGLGGSLSKLNSTDAIYAEIYPEVVASKDFIVELMSVDVKTQEGDVQCDYYTYLRDHQKTAWWNVVFSTIGELLSPTPQDAHAETEKISVFDHSKQQEMLFQAIQGKITCRYDKKTDIVSITVKDQDPLVCALMAEATCKELQKFITNYRTNKARIDYEYYQKLCEKSKADYEKALQKYAASADANTNTVLATYRAKLESMENDMQAKYNIYTAINNQLQAAAAKLQEATPAFTVIESASIPHKPAGPKRMFTSIAMMMMAFFILTVKLLMKKEVSK
jgi:uncharacterized protein involved in exopolysaccharide biosynthesis